MVGCRKGCRELQCATPWDNTCKVRKCSRETHITLVAVVGGFVLHTALVGDLVARGDQLVSQNLDMLHRLKEAMPATTWHRKEAHTGNERRWRQTLDDILRLHAEGRVKCSCICWCSAGVCLLSRTEPVVKYNCAKLRRNPFAVYPQGKCTYVICSISIWKSFKRSFSF